MSFPDSPMNPTITYGGEMPTNAGLPSYESLDTREEQCHYYVSAFELPARHILLEVPMNPYGYAIPNPTYLSKPVHTRHHEVGPAILPWSRDNLREAKDQRFIDECYAQLSTSNEEKAGKLANYILRHQLCSLCDRMEPVEPSNKEDIRSYNFHARQCNDRCSFCATTMPRKHYPGGKGHNNPSCVSEHHQPAFDYQLRRHGNHRDHFMQSVIDHRMSCERRSYEDMREFPTCTSLSHGSFASSHHNCFPDA